MANRLQVVLKSLLEYGQKYVKYYTLNASMDE